MDLSQLSDRQQRFAEDHLYSFTGKRCQCVRAWFDDIEMVAGMLHAGDDSVLLKYAVQNLIDGFKRWYKQNQSNLTTWSDFRRGMIGQFDTRTLQIDTNAQVSSIALTTARRRTIAWHPQHVAHYRSYHGNRSSSTDQISTCSSPPSSIFQFDPAEVPWPDGIESWHIHDIKTQREPFAESAYLERLFIQQQIEWQQERDRLEEQLEYERNRLNHKQLLHAVVPEKQAPSDPSWPDGTESWHVHKIKSQRELFKKEVCPDKLLIEQPNVSQQEPDRSKEALAFEHERLHGEVSPHTVELDNRQSKHEVEFKLNQLESGPVIAQDSDEGPKHLHVVVHASDQLRKLRRILETTIIFHTSKPQQHRYESTWNGRLNDSLPSSHFSSKARSHDRPRNRLLRLVGTRLALLSLFLFSILVRIRIVHYPTPLPDGVVGQSPAFESTFVVDTISTTCSTQYLSHSTPFVQTIEMLRNLESLLIYDVK